MATTYASIPTTAEPAASHVLHGVQVTLKVVFGLVAIVAGADKFTNFLADWESYLNPLALRLIPISGAAFMHGAGVIEIIAGVLVFARPRLGGFVVAAWLTAIALQLILMGRFLDVAVRDIVMAVTGALTLARLTPLVAPHHEPDALE